MPLAWVMDVTGKAAKSLQRALPGWLEAQRGQGSQGWVRSSPHTVSQPALVPTPWFRGPNSLVSAKVWPQNNSGHPKQ